jgi:hypothetical protein
MPPNRPNRPPSGGPSGGTFAAGHGTNPPTTPPTTPPATPPPDPAYTPTQADFALIRRVLDQAGLGSLYNWAVQQMINGAFEDENQLYFALRDTQEFQTRFRGLLERERNGLPPISVQEALAYENQAYQLYRQADFPPGFYDSTDDFQDLIARNVGFNELQQRVALFTEAAGAGREQVREELIRHSGNLAAGDAVDAMSDGDLAAWLMDTDKGLEAVRQRLGSAEVSAAARQVGFGALSYDEATQLLAQGVEAPQARQGFGALAQAGDVTGTLAGENAASGMSREGQLGVVRGVGESVQEFEQRRKRRTGAFEGGGGFATGQEGVSGVGVAY